MEATIKTISLEALSEKLNGKLWVKGDLKRIYVDAGNNTKKMSTKTYIYEKNRKFIVNCTVDCPSQHENWIENQEMQIIESYTDSIEEIIEEYGFEIANPQIAISEALATETQVQGYYMRGDLVRVPINGYGKLAARNRQFITAYKGAESQAPKGFIALLNNADFAVAVEKEKKAVAYDYGEEPNLIGEAQRIADCEAAYKKTDEEMEAQRIAEAQKKKEDAEKAAKDLQNNIAKLKADGITEPLLLWKAAGCHHPAPVEVMDAKSASGLNWKQFQASII